MTSCFARGIFQWNKRGEEGWRADTFRRLRCSCSRQRSWRWWRHIWWRMAISRSPGEARHVWRPWVLLRWLPGDSRAEPESRGHWPGSLWLWSVPYGLPAQIRIHSSRSIEWSSLLCAFCAVGSVRAFSIKRRRGIRNVIADNDLRYNNSLSTLLLIFWNLITKM